MVRNTYSTTPPANDDDYGANGVILYGDGNVVERCTFLRNRAPSYDYGHDGGAVEVFAPASGNYVLRNEIYDSQRAVESGGSPNSDGSRPWINGLVVAYNYAVNNYGFSTFHINTNGNTNPFRVNYSNVRIDNNTVIDRSAGGGHTLLDFSGAPTSEFKFRNNIFYVGWNFTSLTPRAGALQAAKNIVYRENSATVLNGFPVWSSSYPGFISISNPRLESWSVAKNNGNWLAGTGEQWIYNRDRDQNPVPYAGTADIGAFERQSN